MRVILTSGLTRGTTITDNYLHGANPHMDEYACRFRHIVAGIFQIEAGTEKHDYRTGGRQAWAEKVDSVKLADITPEGIRDGNGRLTSRPERFPPCRVVDTF